MGMSTIPSGGLLFRYEDDFEALSTNTFYSVERSMTGTRSGASVAATLAVLEHLGYNGYKNVVAECMRLTNLCVERAAEFGVYPLIEPVMNVVAFRLPHLSKVALKLTAKRWHVSIMNNALRLVIMPHMTESTLVEFMDDLKEIVTAHQR
jgi:tyrosine decarboxylase/aspartate 1-decarboxylase